MKDKLAKGVVWLSGAKVLVNALALCSTFVLARLLSPEDFGLVAIASTMLTVLASVTELSLASALIHHKSPTEAHFHTAWTMNLIRALVLALGFCAASPLVAQAFHDERLVRVMLVLGLSVFLGGMTNPKVVVLTRNLEFWQEFVVAVTQKLLGFVVGVTLALVYKSYWALLGGTLASQTAAVLVSYMVQPYRPRLALKHARELWSFSIWLTLGQVVNTLNWKLDHLMIGRYLGTKTLGVYTVGDNLAGMPTRETIGPIEQTLFPGFRTVAHDASKLRGTYQRAQALISAVALPAGFGCAALAPQLVELVLGPKWVEAVLVVQVLACVFALQTMSSTVHPLALAKGETQLMFRRDLLAFGMRVPIIIAGMWLGGMAGVVYARFITGTLAIAINMRVVQTLIGLTLLQQVGNTWRSLVSVSVMFLVLKTALVFQVWPETWMFKLVVLGLYAALGAAVYVGAHFALWASLSRPVGPETDLLAMIKKVRMKLARISGRVPAQES